MNPLLLDLPTEFSSDRLFLRCYRPGDGAMYHAMLQANWDHLYEFLPASLMAVHRAEDAEVVFRRLMADWTLRNLFIFGLWEKTTGTYAGESYLANADWEVPRIEVGYFIVQDRTRQGYATEAARATIRYAFEHLQVVRVDLRCAADNTASRRVAERCGFVQEGRFRQHHRKKDGTLVDMLWYGLLRAEWLREQTVPTDVNDIDAFWEYSDPALSEARFRTALDSAQGDVRLELLTQIARTFSLRRRFAEAHAVLDDVVAQLANAGPRPRVRYLLERGRTCNSSGESEKARVLFDAAWTQAQAASLEGLAVDAAHMLAITHAGTLEAITWNQRGLAMARGSQDPKARALMPAMLNNSAWDLHALGRYDEALPLFEEAQAAWMARGQPEQIQIARWSVARCLRSLARYDEALAIQQALASEHAAAGTVDGYVFEEIAENLAALDHMDEARPYFAQAFAALSQDEWFVKNEAARLDSLAARASIARSGRSTEREKP